MARKMLIDATHSEETRVVVADGNRVEEFDFESGNRKQLSGNIYLAKVTRVEPSLQAAFVDYGGNRHGFLAFAEIHPDYYQIPVADREALLEEERADAEAMSESDEGAAPKRRRRRSRTQAEKVVSADPVETGEIAGMDVVDIEDDVPDSDHANPAPDSTDETPPADVAVDEETGGDSPSETAEADPPSGGDRSQEEVPDNKPRLRDASEKDDAIESIAEEDVAEEIRQPRKPGLRRYKIQEVIKVRQILLVQVSKEERGNKGAALTTYLSLAGRYCVLMPNTARGGGISRKITNVADRKKLKATAAEIDVPKGAGLIVRTAGAQRTKAEIKRDYEYLQRLWEQIRELTLKSTAPAKIYEEGDLIKRSIRDLYSREIEEVFVEGEAGYRVAKDFMKMIMPSHAKNVKHYSDPMPLFARHQVESYLAGMFNPSVRLKSGGYIVIGVTEALVAIDVNSGRSTREGSVEETALRTNLEAAEEVARQLRLRDLAGLIVIDFIDMDERRNNAAVEKRLKDRLRTDRARIQIGKISGFGLLEMSRQRLRPGMIEVTTQPCTHCQGTGLVRSDDSLALTILRQLEEEGVRRRSGEILLKAPVEIVNFLINAKREHLTRIEERYGLSVRVIADASLTVPGFVIERFKPAERKAGEASVPVVSVDALAMDDMPEGQGDPETGEMSEDAPSKKRRRRRNRRRRGGKSVDPARSGEVSDSESDPEAGGEDTAGVEEPGVPVPVTRETTEEGGDKPKEARSRRRKTRTPESAAGKAEAQGDPPSVPGASGSGEMEESGEPGPEEPAAASAVKMAVEGISDEPVESAVEPADEAGKKPRKFGWWRKGG